MYEKWPHSEQARWWNHTERIDLMQQPEEFRRFILTLYHVVATWQSAPPPAEAAARRMAARSLRTGRTNREVLAGLPKGLVNVVAQQPAAGRPQRPPMSCRLGASVCNEAHLLEKCEHFTKLSPEQQVVKANKL
jgi:hypothetical protein